MGFGVYGLRVQGSVFFLEGFGTLMFGSTDTVSIYLDPKP